MKTFELDFWVGARFVKTVQASDAAFGQHLAECKLGDVCYRVGELGECECVLLKAWRHSPGGAKRRLKVLRGKVYAPRARPLAGGLTPGQMARLLNIDLDGNALKKALREEAQKREKDYAERSSSGPTFSFEFQVDGLYTVRVDAESMEQAQNKAKAILDDTDFGDLRTPGAEFFVEPASEE